MLNITKFHLINLINIRIKLIYILTVMLFTLSNRYHITQYTIFATDSKFRLVALKLKNTIKYGRHYFN